MTVLLSRLAPGARLHRTELGRGRSTRIIHVSVISALNGAREGPGRWVMLSPAASIRLLLDRDRRQAPTEQGRSLNVLSWLTVKLLANALGFAREKEVAGPRSAWP